MARYLGLVFACVFLVGCGGDDSEGGGKKATGGTDAGTGGSTGGSGGSTGGSGGSTGGTGGSTGCTTPDECPAPNSECTVATCENQTCGTAPVASGTPTGNQADGDCKQAVCDGAGSNTEISDDSDVPNDSLECTTDACTAGVPSHTPVAVGTTCNTTDKCDAQGQCVACLTGADCGTATECSTPTCTNGVCGVSFTPNGTEVPIQTAGDCTKVVCDGLGATKDEPDSTDVEDDQNSCTTDTCGASGPVHTPTPNQPCGTNGVCNAQGQCVGCTVASDCSGTDDFCKTKTCVNNVCGVSFTGANTPLPAADQTAGDCGTKVCNGTGSITTVAAPTDVPVDGNACTLDQCTGGTTPANPPAPPGASCSTGGTVCDGAGACVQCVNVSQCGTAAVCNTKACVNNACVNGFSPPGTPCGAASCTGGVAQAEDTCNGSGSCQQGASTNCSPYVCGPTACNPTCASDAGCANGFTCDTGLGVCTNGPKCTPYCNTIATNCQPPYTQYFSMDACLKSCALLPKGTAADTAGNTVGCRTYHAGAAAGTAANQQIHCPHAGPGGDGACGANCLGFCTIAMGACTGSNQVFPSMPDCMNACATFNPVPKYSSTVTSGNSFACRLYHLTNAALGPAEANVHCGHIVTSSPVCQ
jgi:hypothetical protein